MHTIKNLGEGLAKDFGQNIWGLNANRTKHNVEMLRNDLGKATVLNLFVPPNHELC
jgi:hypothetical protein